MSDKVIEFHALVIDEYMANGFNGQKAVMTLRPSLDGTAASGLWSSIIKSQSGSRYLRRRRDEVRSHSLVEQEELIQQMIYWLRSDATDYLELSPKELKALPKEARMCIESINHKKETRVMKNGDKIVTENMLVKLISKTKALDILNKVMGNYELDNMQKHKTIDISKASTEDLNAVLRLMQSQIDENEQ